MKTTIGLFTKELKDHRLVMFIMIEETCCKTRISSSALIFVPGNRADINLVSNSNFTADQQWKRVLLLKETAT
jgi:hypothetical protein